MPCLNEAGTLPHCIARAQAALQQLATRAEIVVADNGSSDGSAELGARLGARVVHVVERGYGSTLRGAIEASRGRYVVMGDSDASYDFGDVPLFVQKLREGQDVVIGNRFRGGIRPGAMPWPHQYIGNPVLSGLGRVLFGSRVGDFHCGMRALTRVAYDRLRLGSTGMEFATEMVARSEQLGLRVAEVPVTLHPDGRGRRSHLRPVRDGLRHLRLMLHLALQGRPASVAAAAAPTSHQS